MPQKMCYSVLKLLLLEHAATELNLHICKRLMEYTIFHIHRMETLLADQLEPWANPVKCILVCSEIKMDYYYYSKCCNILTNLFAITT